MPAEVPTTDSSQNLWAEKMSAVTQKPYGDLQQTTPTFSYAQAAKGRSPSVPSPLPTSKAHSDTTEMDGKRASSSGTGASTADSSKTSTKRTASEGRTPQGEGFSVCEEQHPGRSNDTKDGSKGNSYPDKPASAGPSQTITSTPSSPEYGTTSTSTLPKEEDMFSTMNGSSDSTSDKQSQTSQNGNKASEKMDVEKEQNVTTSWDEEVPVAAPASLKEALPPPVNVWDMRKQAQAKSKASLGPHTAKPANVTNGLANTNGPVKGSETAVEPKKQDSRKKSKTGPGQAEDRSSSGAAKDGSKTADGIEKSVPGAMAPPPPPGDAISWPTPDSAVGDGKKKGQDRVEKGDKDTPQTPKPHGKEKWVPVPYVPTAVFNTPMPPARRAGRGGARGGREGETRGRNPAGAGNGAEKSTLGNASNGQALATGGQERGRAGLTSSTSNSNPSKPKRASSAGPTTVREQRKALDSSVPEKRKETEAAVPKTHPGNGNVSNPSRRPSAPTTTKDSQTVRFPIGGTANEPSWSSNIVPNNGHEDKKNQNEPNDVGALPKAGGPERRSEGPMRQSDIARDLQGNMPSRERGESRPDRGRGGYRGRGGGNHGFYNSNLPNGHGFSNGYPSQYQPPSGSPSKPSNHERLPSQSQGSVSQPSHHQPRQHYRTNSRSQSIPHSTQYGRFTHGHHGGAPHLANLQTDLANEYSYQPGHQGIMSAMPYNPYAEQQSLFSMVTMQMNYYFSVENLCKDMYLRSHMDSQGFVFLDLLAKFNRIKQLTGDMELIRQACHQSPHIDYVNVDGIDRVRAREGWKQWVLKVDERDASVQNDGPLLQTYSQYSYPFEYAPAFDDRQTVLPRSNAIGNPMDDVQYQSLNAVAPPFGPLSAESNPVDASATRTPLSAAVSEFAPSVHSTNHRDFSAPNSNAQGTSVFTDAQVENLRILVRKPLNASAPVPPPFHSSSSRTFSNGSIDGRSIHDELSKFTERQSRPTANGDRSESTEARNLQRSRSPFSVVSPGRQIDNSVSPPVLWIKDRQNPIDTFNSSPNECVHESYHDFRQDALKQREQSAIGKDHHNMQSLYQFWSHFLVRNFNAGMYEEFHRLALEDIAQRESTTGMRSLLRYYDESILSQKTMSDDNIARDFVDLVKVETSKPERPAFSKLRAVWRNGAFNMKNRSKLTKLIDTDLKAELER